MIDTNKEIEEVIRVEKHVLLGCLIGSGGSIIKAINKDFGVRVESEGAKDDQFQTIKIKGSAGRVVPAKHHIMGLVQTFIANTLVFEVADEFMAVLLGKGGASIRTLRDKYPWSQHRHRQERDPHPERKSHFESQHQGGD
jgi:hypothetical protein